MEQLTLLSEEALAKISQLPETEQDFMEAVLLWQGNMSGFLMKYAQGGSCGRTLRGLFQLTEEKISESCSLKWKNAGMVWHGECWMHSISECPNDVVESSLSDILETGDHL